METETARCELYWILSEQYRQACPSERDEIGQVMRSHFLVCPQCAAWWRGLAKEQPQEHDSRTAEPAA